MERLLRKEKRIEDYAGETRAMETDYERSKVGETETDRGRKQLWRLLSKVIFPLKYLTSGFFLLTFVGETSITIP